VTKSIGKIFGGDDSSDALYEAQAKSIAKQDAALDKKESDLAAAEEGQRKARSSNRGLLAFIDDQLKKALG